MHDDFDFKSDDHVVVESRRGIAVYCNMLGEITIRVQGAGEDGLDEALSLTKEESEAVIIGLSREIKEIEFIDESES